MHRQNQFTAPGSTPRPAGMTSPEDSPLPRYRTSDLFDHRSWIVIEHHGVEYRLHVTRLGKLILTK